MIAPQRKFSIIIRSLPRRAKSGKSSHLPSGEIVRPETLLGRTRSTSAIVFSAPVEKLKNLMADFVLELATAK